MTKPLCPRSLHLPSCSWVIKIASDCVLTRQQRLNPAQIETEIVFQKVTHAHQFHKSNHLFEFSRLIQSSLSISSHLFCHFSKRRTVNLCPSLREKPLWIRAPLNLNTGTQSICPVWQLVPSTCSFN